MGVWAWGCAGAWVRVGVLVHLHACKALMHTYLTLIFRLPLRLTFRADRYLFVPLKSVSTFLFS